MNKSKRNTVKKDHYFDRLKYVLICILLIKVAGYFTWSDNINITRAIKIVFRVGMTIAVYFTYTSVIKKGAINHIKVKQKAPYYLYLTYLYVGCLSFLWSSKIGYSALQWFMTAESVIFSYYFISIYLMTEKYFPEVTLYPYQTLSIVVFIIIAIFVIGLYANPDDFIRKTHGGEEERLGGLFMNPNELGMLCSVGVGSFVMYLRICKNKLHKICIVLGIGVLFFALFKTGSRSTLIGCLLIFTYVAFQMKNKFITGGIFIAMFAVLPFAIKYILIKENGGGLEEVMSMTGRTSFWKALLTEGFPKRPLFGFGFMRIAEKDFFQSVHTYAGQMTHNTFIQVLMNLGFIGFIIVVFQLIYTLYFIITCKESNKKMFLMVILIPILINSFTEFGIFGETNYGILFYQLIICYLTLSFTDRLTPTEKKKLLKLKLQ